MNTPTTPVDHSLLSNRAGRVTIGLPTAAMPATEVKPKWKGDFAAQPKPNSPHRSGHYVANGELPEKRPTWLAGERIPSWLVSAIVHAMLLVILVLIQFPPGSAVPRPMLASLSGAKTNVVEFEQLPNQAIDIAINAEQEQERPADIQPLTDNPTAIAIPLTAINTTAEPAKTKTTAASPDLAASLSSIPGQAPAYFQLPSGGLYRRDAQSRAELGQKYGATPESEGAVEAALVWLAAHQHRNGSWSFDLTTDPCNGRCRNSQNESPFPKPATAATGLALLAFLGAGYDHHEGKYADNVRRGLYFLREEARPTVAGLDLQDGSMYGHGIAMMAIGEAMGMTRYQGNQDTDLLALTNGGASFTMNAQHSLGGWRYVPGSPGDMTVTAWQVLSLISAQHGGVFLRTSVLPQAEQFVRSLSGDYLYEFKYQSTHQPEPTATAVGLCLLLYLGESPRHPQFARALNRMVVNGPKFNDVYHDYYATLVLHHARHRNWTAWHVPIRDQLVETQETAGHEAGSWHFPDRHGDVGGRLYTTAMAAMILEVYYRYLPLYQSDDEFKLD